MNSIIGGNNRKGLVSLIGSSSLALYDGSQGGVNTATTNRVIVPILSNVGQTKLYLVSYNFFCSAAGTGNVVISLNYNNGAVAASITLGTLSLTALANAPVAGALLIFQNIRNAALTWSGVYTATGSYQSNILAMQLN